jgi:plastocyanin
LDFDWVLPNGWPHRGQRQERQEFVLLESTSRATLFRGQHVWIERTGGGSEASVTPNIPGFPKDSPICIKSGTTVTWQGAGKNTGFMVDFAASSPFDPSGTISGGSDRPITVTARKAGCFKYSLGACTPGTIYGMCGNSDFELIVTGGQ